ncbi:hypothetical protein WR25_05767 [Diploscapter pachys]|uniref:Proteasome activator PA28 C-terminal domain-containing protein n=1 Tax=Diploscapter pachys TaxID=2018661 RepID=A0A2A2M0Q5_9BILA|nr:hypothetical protein WR25_05767 [Diploscapter pachys]
MAKKENSNNGMLDEYKKKLFNEAERLVKDEFPRKVLEFDEMLKSKRLQYDRLSTILPDSELNIPVPQPNHPNSSPQSAPAVANAKKRKIDNSTEANVNGTAVYGFMHGSVPCNVSLGELMDEIRPKLREAVENVNTVKMWITLLIPRIEDGNNFGVGIQEEMLAEVRNVEGEAASFLDQMSRYFTSRGKLITKIAKYPHVLDYRRAVLDMDEKQFLNIRLVILEMRNHFSSLHDMILKNLEKIKKPRNSHVEHLY